MIDSSSNKGNAIDGGLIKAIVEKNAHLTKENESLKNDFPNFFARFLISDSVNPNSPSKSDEL